MLRFLIEFVKHPKTVGAVMPSEKSFGRENDGAHSV